MILALAAFALAAPPATFKLVGSETNKVYSSREECERARKALVRRQAVERRKLRSQKTIRTELIVEPTCIPW